MKSIFPVALVTAVLAFMPLASAGDTVCAVYITGVGCPNCGVTDPVITSDVTAEKPDCVVIEYEIYQRNADNYPVAEGYFNNYVPPGMPHGVPFLILGDGNSYVGRYEVLNAESVIAGMSSNECPMPDGSSVDFDSLDLVELSGKPNIWSRNRVMVSEGVGGDNEMLKGLLFEEDIAGILEGLGYEEISPVPVQLSGSQAEFEHAVRLEGWLFQWNDKGLNGDNGNITENGNNGGGNNSFFSSSLYSIAAIIILMIVGLFFYFTRIR